MKRVMPSEVEGEHRRPTLRDRQKEQTRLALAAATLELCAEHGFESVTIKDIVERAGTSVRTFYDHYPSKEHAVLFDVDDRMDSLRTRLERDVDEPVLARVHDEFRAIAAERDEGELSDLLTLQLKVIRRTPSLLAMVPFRDIETWQIVTQAFTREIGDEELAGYLAATVRGVASSTAWVHVVSGEYSERMDKAFEFLAAALAPFLNRQ